MLEGYKMDGSKTSFLTEAAEKAMEAAAKAIKAEAEEKIRETAETIKQEEKRDMTLRMLEERAGFTRKLFEEYIENGFTEEQAWELIKIHAAYTPMFPSYYGYANA